MTHVKPLQFTYSEEHAVKFVLDSLIFNKELSLQEVEVEDSLEFKSLALYQFFSL